MSRILLGLVGAALVAACGSGAQGSGDSRTPKAAADEREPAPRPAPARAPGTPAGAGTGEPTAGPGDDATPPEQVELVRPCPADNESLALLHGDLADEIAALAKRRCAPATRPQTRPEMP